MMNLKQIRPVRHGFNTTGTANYRVQLAVPKLGFSTRVGTIVDQKKVLKQAGVVQNIKSQ